MSVVPHSVHLSPQDVQETVGLEICAPGGGPGKVCSKRASQIQAQEQKFR